MNSKIIARGINCDTTAKSRFGRLSKLVVVLMAMILAVTSISLLAQKGNASAASLVDSEPTVTTTTTETLTQEQKFDVNAFDYNHQLESAGIDSNINPLDYGIPEDFKLESRTVWNRETNVVIDHGADVFIVTLVSQTLTESWQSGFLWLTHRSRTTVMPQGWLTVKILSSHSWTMDVSVELRARAGDQTAPYHSIVNDKAQEFVSTNNVSTKDFYVGNYSITAEADGHGHAAYIKASLNGKNDEGHTDSDTKEEEIFFEA